MNKFDDLVQSFLYLLPLMALVCGFVYGYGSINMEVTDKMNQKTVAYNKSILMAEAEYKRLQAIITPEYLKKFPPQKQKELLKMLESEKKLSETPLAKPQDFMKCESNDSICESIKKNLTK